MRYVVLSLLLSSALLFAKEMSITMYESPTCGCCGFWAKYMRENGFKVDEIKTDKFVQIKEDHGIKSDFMSCHTAIIDGYVVEGHVPVDEVKRLLAQKPDDVIGIAVPGMPQGSPGMEQGYEDEEYDVVLMMKDGSHKIYATYVGHKKISKK